MMSRYFEFLCDVVGRTYEYHLLLEHLHGIEFYSLVPNDDNRGVDGECLRELYLDESMAWSASRRRTNEDSLVGPCTVLEMLIGLAKRVEEDLLGSPFEHSTAECFWILIENLGLEWCDDVWIEQHGAKEVDEKVMILLERRYSYDGDGGLFPLRMAQKDQRRVEIWYQMSAWIIENYPV